MHERRAVLAMGGGTIWRYGDRASMVWCACFVSGYGQKRGCGCDVMRGPAGVADLRISGSGGGYVCLRLHRYPPGHRMFAPEEQIFAPPPTIWINIGLGLAVVPRRL